MQLLFCSFAAAIKSFRAYRRRKVRIAEQIMVWTAPVI
jgi:hypothetical protein